MKRQKLAAALRRALVGDGYLLCKHIETVQDEGRYTGIEAQFEASLLRALKLDPNRPRLKVDDIGTTNAYPGRSKGFIDFVIRDNAGAPDTAFEFKAVRMPRRKSWGKGVRFDQYQIVCDYLRLREAKLCNAGWIVAFVYGPLVRDAQTDGELYRSFHNQMALDTRLGDEVDPLRPSRNSRGRRAR